MAIDLQEHIRIDTIHTALLTAKQVQLRILRLDQIHPLVSGNKWFKLKHNIAQAFGEGKASLLTFGGAWSNHLLATAAAAKALGLEAIGLVRGYHGQAQPTETLIRCASLGMKLHYLSREEYARKADATFLAGLQKAYPAAHIIPEGGDNTQGIAGAGDIAAYIPTDTNLVALPVGTGTTFSGIRNRLPAHMELLGFPAMKGGQYLAEKIRPNLQVTEDNWLLQDAYDFGGFARYNGELLTFMNTFFTLHNVPLDIVYTAKMMYGITDLLEKDYFSPGTRIVCIHTGGLQGNHAVRQSLQYA